MLSGFSVSLVELFLTRRPKTHLLKVVGLKERVVKCFLEFTGRKMVLPLMEGKKVEGSKIGFSLEYVKFNSCVKNPSEKA